MNFKVANELFGVTTWTSTTEAHDDETPEVFKISDEEKVSVLAFQC